MTRGMQLRKHLGLGNDFLILIDLEDRHRLDAGTARAVCDRHTGAGADGIIRVTPGAGSSRPLAMELRNADGSPAETSGNGLRCLGQALVLAGLVDGPEVVVDTAAGRRRLEVGPTGADGVAQVSVAMGRPVLGDPVPQEDPSRRAVRVDLGNPHLVVLVDDPAAVDLAAEGPVVESRYPGGINVEYAAVVGSDRVELRTWERGAGETLACGSGSCATTAALHAWGLVGPGAVVHNPGGDLTVTLREGEAVLTGPSQFVCTVVMA